MVLNRVLPGSGIDSEGDGPGDPDRLSRSIWKRQEGRFAGDLLHREAHAPRPPKIGPRPLHPVWPNPPRPQSPQQGGFAGVANAAYAAEHLLQMPASPAPALKAMLTAGDAAAQEIPCNPDPSASNSGVAG